MTQRDTADYIEAGLSYIDGVTYIRVGQWTFKLRWIAATEPVFSHLHSDLISGLYRSFPCTQFPVRWGMRWDEMNFMSVLFQFSIRILRYFSRTWLYSVSNCCLHPINRHNWWIIMYRFPSTVYVHKKGSRVWDETRSNLCRLLV